MQHLEARKVPRDGKVEERTTHTVCSAVLEFIERDPTAAPGNNSATPHGDSRKLHAVALDARCEISTHSK